MAWLYVPDTADSNSESISITQATGWCVWSKGKPMQPRSIVRAWKTKPWMKLLSGMTSEPLTVDRGLASWIYSLRATRANLSQRQVSSSVRTTPDTSGPTSRASSENVRPYYSSAKTSARTSRSASTQWSKIWDGWVTQLGQYSRALLTLGHPTEGSGSSSLLWRKVIKGGLRSGGWGTPLANDWHNGLSPAELRRTGPGLRARAAIFQYGLQGLKEARRIGTLGDLPTDLNPCFVEAMMGLPRGWTGLEPVETASFQLWQRQHSTILSVLMG